MKKLVLLVTVCLVLASGVIYAQQKTRKIPVRKRRSSVFKVPNSVTVQRDVVYATYGDRKVTLDIYLPKNPPTGKLPCIITVHGGGWRNGDKNKFARFASKFAEKGFAAACIGYRLIPEVGVPQCIEDAKASVRWVRANAKKYNIDPDRFGAFGGSAGAHLVAMLGTSFKVDKLEGDGGNKGVSSRVHAVVAMATPADMTAFSRFSKTTEIAKLISPVTYVDKDSAKFLLIHARGDGLVPYKQSILLQDKLTKAAVAVQLITIENKSHAFWNGNSPTAQKIVADSIAFFQKALKRPKSKPDKN
jgi:acetyl esterase/lipase